MGFQKLVEYREVLTLELNKIAQQYQLHSLLIMESTPETMVVFAANEQPIYSAGDAGPKSNQKGCHELYCERVVNTEEPLLVSDASQDKEWKGNADLVEFGLGVYYGVPIMHKGKAVGTVCALNDKPFDFMKGEPNVITRLNDVKLDVERHL